MEVVAGAIARTVALHVQGPCFGVIGGGNLNLVAALDAQPELTYRAARREDAAVSMADGYARRSGGHGVCTVTHGPGLTNTVTALTEAARAGSPIVLICGDIARASLDHAQDVDQPAIVRPTGALWMTVRAPVTASEDVSRAFREAHAQSRPVVLNVPVDLQTKPFSGSQAGRRVPVARQRTRPAGQIIGRAADVVLRSRRPVLLAGRGAVDAGARGPLESLADSIGALLCTTLRARGLFHGHPFDVGVCGGFGSALAARYIRSSDCLLAFGASLDPRTIRRGQACPSAEIIHVDIAAERIGRWTPADLAVVGDAGAVAEALRSSVPEPRTGFRTTGVREEIAASLPTDEFVDQSTERTCDPRSLCVALDELLPGSRTVVVDAGHFTSEVCKYVTVQEPERFIFPVNYIAVGLGLSVAIGAALARPEGLTVAFVGDGGLMMSLQELDTVKRYGVPLLVVVMNDAGYGMEVHKLAAEGLPVSLGKMPSPDFVSIAREMGLHATSVRSLGDLTTLRGMLHPPRLPMLVDARLNPHIVSDWFRSTMATAEQPKSAESDAHVREAHVRSD